MSSNGETKIPSFDEIARTLSKPLKGPVPNPERSEGSRAAIEVLLILAVRVMSSKQKQSVRESAVSIRRNLGAISFQDFKETNVLRPRFAGMLHAIDDVLKLLDSR